MREPRSFDGVSLLLERKKEKLKRGKKLVSDNFMIIFLERDFLPVEEHLRSNRATPLVVVLVGGTTTSGVTRLYLLSPPDNGWLPPDCYCLLLPGRLPRAQSLA